MCSGLEWKGEVCAMLRLYPLAHILGYLLCVVLYCTSAFFNNPIAGYTRFFSYFLALGLASLSYIEVADFHYSSTDDWFLKLIVGFFYLPITNGILVVMTVLALCRPQLAHSTTFLGISIFCFFSFVHLIFSVYIRYVAS